jgi:hypothetical protein
MTKCCCLLVLALVLVPSIYAQGQYDGPPLPNELGWTAGAGCQYNYTNIFGDIGCWADGNCYDNSYVDVGWYQWWDCTLPATAWGNSAITQTATQASYYQFFDHGVQANGAITVISSVYPYGPVSFDGANYEDCDGGTDYYPPGGYSYSC